jgi:Rieske Fe-S protein
MAATGLLSAGLGAAIMAPVLTMVAHPLWRETTSGADEFLPAGSIDQFTEDEPVKVDLFADRVDAWNRVIQVKVGSAWVLNRGGALVALSAVCPHLGCGVDYDPAKGKFLCACHQSWFALDGEVEDGPSPRGMDPLEIAAGEKLVSIRYQRFKQGTDERTPV